MRFAPIGEEGQARLRESAVLLVGVGALGSHVAAWLTRAGVGRLVLCDRDVVDASNLQRQVLFTEADVGEPKAHAAAAHLRAANGEVAIEPLAADFGPPVFERLPRRPDLILDGTDNFATRYLLNDLAARARIPWIYGGVVGSRGTAMVVLPGDTPCLRCAMPEAPPGGESETCETAGVLATAVAAVAAFQATEAIKLLSGNAAAVTRGILVLDVWRHAHDVRMAGARPAAHCPVCSGGRYPALDGDWSQPVVLCGRDAVQVQPRSTRAVDLQVLAGNLRGTAHDVELTTRLLRFSVEECRFSVFPDGRALLFGVADPIRARILYDRWVGA